NQQLGCAILVVTHDQQLANSCQRIIQLSDGHIVADGPC
ncbi:MAG: ABC transporter ATP-binding protein, partial [Pseudomonas sp.]|nr:ABC transporter ATP-binding protein [Pseudomonas sp.]